MKKKKVSQVAKEMGVSSKEKAIRKTTAGKPKVKDKPEAEPKAKTIKPKVVSKKKELKQVKPKAVPRVTKPVKPKVKIKEKPKVVTKKEEAVVQPPQPSPPPSVRPGGVVVPRVPTTSLNLKPRPPIVTVMGHVDHGKTTLLDAIRQTDVAAKEAGQITQHIGAYEVDVKVGNTSGKIVFLDTPGHEAFTAMRARGTQVTDIVVLVVAGDDGVMPQTIEAIDHARAANVPIIVAINKIDKESANPDQTKQQLSNYALIPEEWGGETIFLPVSALKKEGIDHMLEMILLQAEMLELKADPAIDARGTVIEARLDRHMGPVATVIVKEGTLKVGDTFIIGTMDGEAIVPTGSTAIGKVRALINDRGMRVQEALPSTPIEVLGLEGIPQAGETLQVLTDKKILKEIEGRKELSRAISPPRRLTLEDLYKQVKEGEVKELKIILKVDVQGSVEAITKGLENLEPEEVKLQIIHKGVGEINEADIMLASASNTIVVGFNVNINQNAKKVAQYEEVDVRLYKIIYDLITDVKKALEGILPPKIEEVFLGRAEVTTIFKVSKIGTVAGSRIVDGKITRDSRVKLLRKGTVIYEGKISGLKRFKDDVREVEKGFECGLTLDNFNDIKEGDIIETSVMQQVK